MATAALPSELHDHALDLFTRRLGRRPDPKDALGGLGNAVAVALMLDVEEAFGVLIDVDEVLPGGTVGDLIALAELRRPRFQRPGATLIDLAEARARRARLHPDPLIPAQAGTQAEPQADPQAAPPPAPAAEPSPAPTPAPIAASDVDRAWRIAGWIAAVSMLAGGAAAVAYTFLAPLSAS